MSGAIVVRHQMCDIMRLFCPCWLFIAYVSTYRTCSIPSEQTKTDHFQYTTVDSLSQSLVNTEIVRRLFPTGLQNNVTPSDPQSPRHVMVKRISGRLKNL
ncbi:hypothetical protein F5Y18DRAFT_380762 [Xylariaceae sp. FL1019]|nr:hypothetical protein F5Y18DRAFT_380762 [Xylariaceae sp. FL1019]